MLHGGQDQTDREFTIQEFKVNPFTFRFLFLFWIDLNSCEESLVHCFLLASTFSGWYEDAVDCDECSGTWA